MMFLIAVFLYLNRSSTGRRLGYLDVAIGLYSADILSTLLFCADLLYLPKKKHIAIRKMSGKALFKKMYGALEKNVASSHQTHTKEILKKQDALIQYKRMQYINAGKELSKEEDERLVDDVKQKFISQMPKINTDLLSHLDKEEHHPVEAEHVENIATFLDSQRVYIELLERYNPGISMKQTDKVRKTARRVGLEVPE